MDHGRRNVLVLVKGLGIGGAERLISEGARFWDRDTFDYTVAYVLPWKDQLVPDLDALGVDSVMIGSDRGLTPSAGVRLRKLVGERSIDLIHAHLPTMGVLARMTSPVPVVYTEHNLAHSYRPPTRLAARMTYGRNAALIAVSEAVAGEVAGWPGPDPIVIPNGVACAVSAEERAAARSELGLRAGDTLVTHVGNIRPGKGHDNLIEAAREVLAHRPDVTFVSIGTEKNHGDLDRVRARAADEGIGERILFLGRRPDALSFVAAADVFVNPSEIEGLPVAVLEAMALQRPIVATAAGGVPTIIIDEETGLLVQPSDPMSLAKGIERMLDDRELATRTAGRARELVERDFSLRTMVESTEAVYRSVLDG